MDFHQLKVFVEVARQKSFSRAAENIFLSQPTVSAHIKTLENEVGAQLLDRSQRELQLTGAGKVLLRYATELLNIKEEALISLAEERRIISGHLEIASSSVPGSYILPELLKSFQKKHPGVTFAVMLRDTRRVQESVGDYHHDLGFVGEPVCPDGLGEIKLLQDELILIAAPAMSLPGEGTLSPPAVIDLDRGTNAEDFLALPFVMREPGSATREVFEKALERYYGPGKAAPRVIAYLESQEAIKEAVKKGLGVSVISRHAVKDELAAGLMKGCRLAGLHLKRSFYLIYHRNRVLSPLSRAFLDHCVGHFKAQQH